MPQDKFKELAVGLSSPATEIEEITPSDTVDLLTTTRALNVANSGIVRVTSASGHTADVYIAAGTAFPFRAVRVWSTGTTAAGIRGLS
ncbi:MAG: hypothetical protein AAFR35_00330 [Pseudomonadota bacterium]